MVKCEIKFGRGTLDFSLPGENYMGTLHAAELPAGLRGEAEVRRALAAPIESPRLSRLVRPGEKIAVVTSDITRPMPSDKVLPAVLEELRLGGIREEDVTVVLALGSHRGHTEEEKRRLVGDRIWQSRVSVLDSDMEDCVELGLCNNGTPVDIFRPVAEADRRICLGNIEFHYFAGYSGGSKALMPGVSSHRAIQANHSNMVKPGAYAGNLDTNPVRQDIEQITEFISIDFIVNVVLNEKKEIVYATAGHHRQAHRAGCRILDQMYKIQLSRPADIVVLSAGGFPKDINLYQAQKGLDNARHAVREGGILIWCASAKEGFGEKVFEEWMRTKKPAEMIAEIQRSFRLGGHKAAAIAMTMQRADIFMVSDLPDELIRSLGFTPFSTPSAALAASFSRLKEIPGSSAAPQVLVMPQAGSTLPCL